MLGPIQPPSQIIITLDIFHLLLHPDPEIQLHPGAPITLNKTLRVLPPSPTTLTQLGINR